MVRIRLSRMGRKNRPFYRIVVCDARVKRDGKYIEKLGYYDPLKKENNITIDKERLSWWVSRGAQISDALRSLLKKEKITIQ